MYHRRPGERRDDDDGYRHCEERSDEAIQDSKEELDCFASLAMTLRCGSAFSRHRAPEVCKIIPAQENQRAQATLKRGRREDRVRAAPAVSRAKCT
jgi:hypothetical protein